MQGAEGVLEGVDVGEGELGAVGLGHGFDAGEDVEGPASVFDADLAKCLGLAPCVEDEVAGAGDLVADEVDAPRLGYL